MCVTPTDNQGDSRNTNIVEISRNDLPSKIEGKSYKDYKKGAEGWGTRHTFLVLGFTGFVLCYALRFNLSIAIVKMVNPLEGPKSPSRSILTLANLRFNKPQMPIHGPVIPPHQICPLGDVEGFQTVSIENSTGSQNLSFDEAEDGTKGSTLFRWTEEQQGLILGSFFWGYIITQYPGGKLSHVYGPKWVFLLGILVTGILSLILPIVTETFDRTGITIIRIWQGLAEGVTLPSILVMLTHWSPVEERSRMTNWIYAGIPMGTALTMIAGGYLISFFGWPSVFYSTGIVTIIWFVFWSFLVFNNPSEHPRITRGELEYIQFRLGEETTSLQENVPTPWKSVLTSLPVWAIFITDLGDSWSHYLLHAEIPIYLSSVHGFNIETNGWLSALPQIINCTFAILVAYVTDYVIRKKYASVLFTRKFCSSLALCGASLGFLGMILGGCHTFLAVASLNFAAGIAGASNSGWVVNHIEIAPNHAGTISGVANSFGNSLGFLAPYVTGLILEHDLSLRGWKTALAIPAAISFSVNLFYLAFASSSEQPWNKPAGIKLEN